MKPEQARQLALRRPRAVAKAAPDMALPWFMASASLVIVAIIGLILRAST